MTVGPRGMLALLFVSLADNASARTWLVTPNGTGDAPTIQAAIDSSEPGDSILLAPGTYTWTSQGATGHSMVRMKASTTLTSEAGPEATILDAEQRGRVILCQNVGSDVLIEGLTLQHGDAIGTTTPPFVLFSGAGILADQDSHPTVSNCIIRDNRMTRFGSNGAGIFCFQATVKNCRILNNSGPLDSVGIGISSLGRLVISGSTIKGNHSFGDCCATGGGVWAVEADMSDCWIEGNSARANNDGRGGGASIGRGTISRCTFLNNMAAVTSPFASTPAYGGALKAGECTVTDCVFIGNAAIGGGAPGAGGAIGSTSSNLLVTVIRCTFIGNRAGNNGAPFPPAQEIGGVAAVLGNVTGSIIAWSEGLAVNSTMTTSCTNFYGNSRGDEFRGVEQQGNFTADPEFCAIDPTSSLNVSLQEDSPCAPGRHPDGIDCGRIGAANVGCAAVSVDNRTWGEVKTLFR